MNTKAFFLTFFSLFLLNACVSKPPSKTNSLNNNSFNLAAIKFSHVSEVLNFIESFSTLKPSAQKSEIVASKKVLVKNKNDLVHRIKLASMLALTSSELRNPKQAEKMLHALLQEKTLNNEDTALVHLLHEYARMNHYHLLRSHEKVKKMRQKNDVLLQKNEALKQKINDLKNIEKTMIKRNSKIDKKP